VAASARASALAGAVTEAASGGLVAGVERKFVGNAISGFTKHGINQVINRGVNVRSSGHPLLQTKGLSARANSLAISGIAPWSTAP